MVFCIMKIWGLAGLIYIFALANTFGTASPPAWELKPVDDPLILPYRFEIRDKLISESFDYTLPIKIHEDGRYGMFIIGDRASNETASSILFYADIERQNAIWHYHVPTDHLAFPLIADFDNDGLEEATTCYVIGDSLWLEIVHVNREVIHKKYIIGGVDRDNSGKWDAQALMLKAYDFNKDGYKEILFAVDCGYDLYPRCVICLDWKNDNILWRYDIAGMINNRNVHLIENPHDNRLLVIFGVMSKGNAAVAGDMDDAHSYMIVLDEDGREKWKVVTGGSFTTASPVVYDFNRDNAPEILVARSASSRAEQTDSSAAKTFFVDLFSLDGTLLAEKELPGISMVRDAQLYDYRLDGIPEVFLTASQKRLLILDHELNVSEEVVASASFTVCDCRDYLDREDNQLLIVIEATKLILTDNRFKPLAEIDGDGPFDVGSFVAIKMPSREQGYTIFAASGISSESYVYELVKAPWHTIFSRKPLLAFLAGAVPLGIIATIIWSILTAFRRKNKIIEEQKNRLDKALTDLRDAQEELVAAEKYRQAKDIAGGVAHEILNALYPARTALESMKERLADRSPESLSRQHKLTDLAERSVDRAMNMVGLVKTYSRLDAEKKAEKTSLAALIAEIIESNKDMIDRTQAKITTAVSEGIKININRIHAYSMLNNLLLNSLQAMESSPQREIRIAAIPEDNLIRIEMADTGPGIPEGNLERIFDAFFTTRPSSGTGLGLSIVKRIVSLYDGRIFVESVLDKGTKFSILISGSE